MSQDNNTQVKREQYRITPQDLSTWRVLIVDDSADNLWIASTALSYHGAAVKTAGDGMEGLEVIKNFLPNLILLDLSMPRMDGWKMFDAVKREPGTTHIPVIALTAHVMTGDRERVLRTGFAGHIAKPFSVTTIVSDIQTILKDTGNTEFTDNTL